MDYRQLATQYWANGFQVIPVTSDKNPAIPSWGRYLHEDMPPEDIDKYFKDCWGIAMLMGGKQSLTGFDFDLKYDIVGDVMERFRKGIEELSPSLMSKMYINTTKNKGYHLIVSCPSRVDQNKKLASRYTTYLEKHETYMEAYRDVNTRDKAINIAHNDRSRVLIETRGQGGYILIPPSDGYKHVYGSTIPILTPEEYDILISVSYSINEVTTNKSKLKDYKYNDWTKNPFNDFNERGDFVKFMQDQGWEVIDSGTGKNVRFRRPCNPKSKDSAVFDKDTRRFKVFSTSTIFNVEENYSPVDVVAKLLFEDDTIQTYNYLVENGFGIKF